MVTHPLVYCLFTSQFGANIITWLPETSCYLGSLHFRHCVTKLPYSLIVLKDVKYSNNVTCNMNLWVYIVQSKLYTLNKKRICAVFVTFHEIWHWKMVISLRKVVSLWGTKGTSSPRLWPSRQKLLHPPWHVETPLLIWSKPKFAGLMYPVMSLPTKNLKLIG